MNLSELNQVGQACISCVSLWFLYGITLAFDVKAIITCSDGVD